MYPFCLGRGAKQPGDIGEAILLRLPGKRPIFLVRLAFAGEGRLMAPHRRDDLGQADLIELLSLDDDGFRAKFRGTPMKRTKRRGVLRNVCVALGNIGDATALPPLERAAADPEPLIAEHAQWALGQVRQRCGVDC